jgi:hypothetical protein
LYTFLIVYVHAVWPLRVIVLGLMPPIIFGKFYIWWSSSLLNFLHSSHTSSLFQITSSTCSAWNCHPCTKQQLATFFFTLIFILLCKKGEEKEDAERKDNYSTFMGSKCNIHMHAVLWASVMHRTQYDFSVRFFTP